MNISANSHSKSKYTTMERFNILLIYNNNTIACAHVTLGYIINYKNTVL